MSTLAASRGKSPFFRFARAQDSSSAMQAGFKDRLRKSGTSGTGLLLHVHAPAPDLGSLQLPESADSVLLLLLTVPGDTPSLVQKSPAGQNQSLHRHRSVSSSHARRVRLTLARKRAAQLGATVEGGLAGRLGSRGRC